MCDEKCRDKIKFIEKHIRSYPDFPKPGIVFRDVFSVLQQPDVFKVLEEVLIEFARSVTPPVDSVVALDARGFLFGPLIALKLGIPFVPVRKRGKLPGNVASMSYKLEYGEDTIEIQTDSIKTGDRVLIVDDLLATGGTLSAACQLIRKLNAEVASCLVIIELDLNGRDKVPADILSIVKF